MDGNDNLIRTEGDKKVVSQMSIEELVSGGKTEATYEDQGVASEQDQVQKASSSSSMREGQCRSHPEVVDVLDGGKETVAVDSKKLPRPATRQSTRVKEKLTNVVNNGSGMPGVIREKEEEKLRTKWRKICLQIRTENEKDDISRSRRLRPSANPDNDKTCKKKRVHSSRDEDGSQRNSVPDDGASTAMIDQTSDESQFTGDGEVTEDREANEEVIEVAKGDVIQEEETGDDGVE